MNVLEEIVEARRVDVRRLRRSRTALVAAAGEASAPRPLGAALRRAGEVALIAEHKRRSPSAGWIRADSDAASTAAAYARAGASALSVLTEAEHFGGLADDLRRARAAVDLPVLRKDFIVDPLQVVESRALGADALLLIVRVLDGARLEELLAAARELGMDALVEVHDANELRRALAAGAGTVGVNSRDLTTFRTDLGVALALAPEAPPDIVLVAESGIGGPEDVDRLGEVGYDAVLVGESLMRQPDPGAAAARLTRRPRRARGEPAGDGRRLAGGRS